MANHSRYKNVVLQHRDQSLIRILTEDFRILTTEQIAKLFSMGSNARLSFRLKQLCDAGYLSARALARFGSASKYGYFVGPRAKELFQNPTDQRIVASIHNEVPQFADSTLAHRILVDSVHIRFLTAARDYPEYKLLTWVDQYSPSWEELNNYGVPGQADGYGEYLMLMHFDSLFTCFIEVDRGTERGRTIQEKIERYIHYADSGDYEQKFAARQFRVLFVTTNTRRVQGLATLIGAQRSNLFWLTTWEQMQSAKLFDAYWIRPGQDGLHSLISRI